MLNNATIFPGSWEPGYDMDEEEIPVTEPLIPGGGLIPPDDFDEDDNDFENDERDDE